MVYKYCINLDRLELTFDKNEPLQTMLSDTIRNEFEFDSLRLVREQCKCYSNEFSILVCDYDEQLGTVERRIGHLHFGSPNPNRPYIYVLFENEALYDDYLLASRFYVQDALGLEFLRVSKIDIAVDFNFNIINRFYRIFKSKDYSIVLNGKKQDDTKPTDAEVLHIAEGTTRFRPFAHHSPVFKNKQETMQMKAYDKDKEIDTESHKKYIREKAGFKRLYRMEVSLGCHKVVKKMLDKLAMTDEELYARLQHERTLIDLFLAGLNSLIRVTRSRRSMSILDAIFADM